MKLYNNINKLKCQYESKLYNFAIFLITKGKYIHRLDFYMKFIWKNLIQKNFY